MKLTQLKALVAIGETGSIQRAALKVGLTQPALSKAIRALEEELGANLLSRGVDGTTLTTIGRAVYQRSLRIQSEIGALRDEVETSKGELTGRIALGVTKYAAGSALMDAVTKFHQRRPKVEIVISELQSQHVVAGMKNRTFDFGLFTLYGDERPTGFETHYLSSLPTVLVGGGQRAQTRISLDQLLNETWVCMELSEEQESYIEAFARGAKCAAPTRVHRCGSAYLALEMAAVNRGVTNVAEMLLPFMRSYMENKGLKLLQPDVPLPQINVMLALHREDTMSLAAQEMKKVLLDSLRLTKSASGAARVDLEPFQL